MPEVLDVLFGSNYKSAEARYFAMQALLDKLGKVINPRFAKAMKQVEEAGTKALLTSKTLPKKTNAPGFL